MTATCPRSVVPCLKVTVPVAPEGVTFALKTVDWLAMVGLVEDARAVLVATWRTVWLTGAEVLPK